MEILINEYHIKGKNKDDLTPTEKVKDVINNVRSKMQNQYKHFFLQEINKSKNGHNKLRTYKYIKTDYKIEKYLTLNLTRIQITNFAKLRISAHNLHIETGRYQKPKSIPETERVCKFCPSKIENECHFVMECSRYNDIRENLMHHVHITHPEINSEELDMQEKFVKIITTNNDTLLIKLLEYVNSAFHLRQESELAAL